MINTPSRRYSPTLICEDRAIAMKLRILHIGVY
jgi:hypothetical protein